MAELKAAMSNKAKLKARAVIIGTRGKLLKKISPTPKVIYLSMLNPL